MRNENIKTIILDAAETLLRQVIILLTRMYGKETSPLPARASVPVVTRAGLMPIIEDAFFYRHQTLTLGQLASLLNLSVRQTQRLLQQNFGKTFSQKLTEARMAAASQYLLTTELSVTEITGLAGQDGMEEHALLSARALSRMNPEYIGLMTLTLRRGTKMTADWEAGRFKRLTPRQYLEEQRILIANLDSEGSVLRSNHISNYVQLRGTMNRDRDRMLAALDGALQDPELDNPYIEYLENL